MEGRSQRIMADGSEEQLVDSAKAAVGELVKIAASYREHWACRKACPAVARNMQHLRTLALGSCALLFTWTPR